MPLRYSFGDENEAAAFIRGTAWMAVAVGRSPDRVRIYIDPENPRVVCVASKATATPAPRTLTPEQVAAYIAADGDSCPFCGSDAIEAGGSVHAEAGIAWQTITCAGCAAAWQDTYKLVAAGLKDPATGDFLEDVYPPAPAPSVKTTFTLDKLEARGSLTVESGSYGFTLEVNGRAFAWIDLFPCIAGGPPQLIVEGYPDDEPLCKIVIATEGNRLVVNRDAVTVPAPAGVVPIHDGERFLAIVVDPVPATPEETDGD